MVPLDKLMQPFAQAISAIQGSTTTLADRTRMFMYLARTIMSVGPDVPRGDHSHQNLACFLFTYCLLCFSVNRCCRLLRSSAAKLHTAVTAPPTWDYANICC